jgi:hypothetical protein
MEGSKDEKENYSEDLAHPKSNGAAQSVTHDSIFGNMGNGSSYFNHQESIKK